MEVKVGQVWRRVVDRSGNSDHDTVIVTRHLACSCYGYRICSSVTGADMGYVSNVFLATYYDFLYWDRKLLSHGHCPHCSNKLAPTLFDYLVLCPDCGEKFRFVGVEDFA